MFNYLFYITKLIEQNCLSNIKYINLQLCYNLFICLIFLNYIMNIDDRNKTIIANN